MIESKRNSNGKNTPIGTRPTGRISRELSIGMLPNGMNPIELENTPGRGKEKSPFRERILYD